MITCEGPNATVIDRKDGRQILPVVDEGIDRTRIGGVLSVISVQAPSVHGNTERSFVRHPSTCRKWSRCVQTFPLDHAQGVHDQIGSGCDASRVRITRAVTEARTQRCGCRVRCCDRRARDPAQIGCSLQPHVQPNRGDSGRNRCRRWRSFHPSR